MGTAPGNPLPAQNWAIRIPRVGKPVTHTHTHTDIHSPAQMQLDANPAAGRLLKALGLSNLNAAYPASC